MKSCYEITFWGRGTSAMQSVANGSTSNTEPDSDIRLCFWTKSPTKHVQHFDNIKTVRAVITNSVQQSPSCKANKYAASQEIPHMLRGPKV